MAQVDIEVNGRFYRMLCEDGQEGRLRELAAYVDDRLQRLTGGGRSGPEAQMMLMTCLVLADELQEVMAGKGIAPAVDETAVVGQLDAVTKRIEEVAARLERA
ncbi:cell division protein ZapA [Azospirillum picis]|uniref:Cell division protein ZapA n=1 Tax=Azospirillum picis TaxID=488438 RepID=A0ABU0MEN7_9PROT|nr:cell division protein ZapA [Azospirillum picis]MBP2298062.1 cell division protein ZapA [Azospirillum picis]MDQ0531900.1 cell division protein ZapA [Azospirillum picis]